VPSQAELTLGALALIQSVPPDQLATIASARAIFPQASWTPVDLARALSSSEAIWHQLRQLDRDVLVGLNSLWQENPPTDSRRATQLPEQGLVEQGLCEQGLAELTPRDGAAGTLALRPEVAHAIASQESLWRDGLERLHGVTAVRQAQASAESVSLGPAPTHMLTVIALLIWAVEELMRLPRKTKTSTPAALARTLPVLPNELTTSLHTALTEANLSGLIGRDDGAWQAGPEADAFLDRDLASQWQFLLEAWTTRHDSVLWRAIAGARVTDSDQLADIARESFPLADLSHLDAWVERGRALGVFSGHSPTDIWLALRSPVELTEVLQRVCPPPATHVYPDSVDSFIAPGLLTRAQRDSLSRVARCVTPGMTSSWQVDPERIVVALSTQAPEAILAGVEEVILGGAPSSLRELVVDTHHKASRLQVTPSDRGTTIALADSSLEQLLLVDAKCRPLRLSVVAERILHSPVAVDQARVILAEAGYPTFAPTSDHTRPRTPASVAGASDQPSALPASWWATLTQQAKEITGSTLWTEEILREAIRDRVTLLICVEEVSGSRWFTLEPKAIASGRLRALDRVAEVERTFPLATIRAMEPATKGSGHTA
jgi:hypothetical protein